MLRLGVALVAVDAQYIAPCRRRQCVSLRSFQAPRMIKNSDSVSDEPRLEPTPSVVCKSRSVSVQHLLRRYISATAGAQNS